MAQGFRPDRVADSIRAEMADLLAHGVRDPGLGFVTLTRVKVTADLQIARVFYTALGDQAARRASARALERAAPYLRRQIGSRLRLRRVPEIEFLFDESVERLERVERLIAEIHQQSAEEAAPGGANGNQDRDGG
ncbi:MAG: 30S ribosome-binding factor RbfA [Vicinamibacterales bacterium]